MATTKGPKRKTAAEDKIIKTHTKALKSIQCFGMQSIKAKKITVFDINIFNNHNFVGFYQTLL